MKHVQTNRISYNKDLIKESLMSGGGIWWICQKFIQNVSWKNWRKDIICIDESHFDEYFESSSSNLPHSL